MLSLDSILHNRYRIERLHEIGAVETIYFGWDILSEKAVIVSETKAQPHISPDELTDLKQQFRAQAEKMCNLHHEHLVPPMDYFMIEQQLDTETHETVLCSYVVAPALSDDSLMQRINKQTTLPEKSVMKWADHILDALAYCHQRHILHGDIRPHNIFITADGNAKLANFEVPTLWRAADPRKWTAKRVLGIPDYAPPEKWALRVGQIDERSDLYSLGATLYHALTGECPLSAEERTTNPYNFQEIQFANPKISVHLKNVIAKSMAIPREKRFDSASAMAIALHPPATSRARDIRPALPSLYLPANHKPTIWVKIAWLILSSIVLFFAANIGFWLNERIPPIDTWFSPAVPIPTVTLTPTPIPTATELAKATPTLIPTTSSPTVTPTEQIVLPTIDQVAVISDTFSTNEYRWPITDHQDDWGSIIREVTDGVYAWQIDAEQDVGRWCLPDNNSYAGNYRLSVDVRLVNGPANIAYGLIIRHNEGRYYVFNARDDGYYRFSLWQGNEWITIIDWTETRTIRPGEVNHLEVIARDAVFEFYINESFVDDAEDQEILAGDNGLSAIVMANPDTALIEFDNFVLISENPR